MNVSRQNVEVTFVRSHDGQRAYILAEHNGEPLFSLDVTGERYWRLLNGETVCADLRAGNEVDHLDEEESIYVKPLEERCNSITRMGMVCDHPLDSLGRCDRESRHVRV